MLENFVNGVIDKKFKRRDLKSAKEKLKLRLAIEKAMED